jgi:hypothetical protein
MRTGDCVRVDSRQEEGGEGKGGGGRGGEGRGGEGREGLAMSTRTLECVRADGQCLQT